MLYIIAGNEREARYFLNEFHINPKQARFVQSATELRNLSKNAIFCKVGNWYNRSDINEIEDIISTK